MQFQLHYQRSLDFIDWSFSYDIKLSNDRYNVQIALQPRQLFNADLTEQLI